jgi:MarR family transcriptional regulator, 2-MHQ and catechol-resistance regulon repressor
MKAIQREMASSGVHLWLLLWKATRSVEAFAWDSVRATGLGLSDFGVLEALFHKGPLPVNALRHKVLLSSGSMTAAVDRLEQKGLVKRVATPDDRRSRIVPLTDQGSRVISKLFEVHARDMERAFSSFSAAERATLGGLLRKIGTGVEALKTGEASLERKQR